MVELKCIVISDIHIPRRDFHHNSGIQFVSYEMDISRKVELDLKQVHIFCWWLSSFVLPGPSVLCPGYHLSSLFSWLALCGLSPIFTEILKEPPQYYDFKKWIRIQSSKAALGTWSPSRSTERLTAKKETVGLRPSELYYTHAGVFISPRLLSWWSHSRKYWNLSNFLGKHRTTYHATSISLSLSLEACAGPD